MKYSVGIDLGGTNIGAGIVGEDGSLVYKNSFHITNSSDINELTSQIVSAVKTSVLESGVSDISFVGMGVPGVSSGKEGPVILAPNIFWKNIDIVSQLKEQTGYDVMLGNDADCAAVGELVCGAGKTYDSFLMLTLGTGLGGAYVNGGKLIKFGNGFGGEFGHFPLIHDGAHCNCGKSGCFEAYASARALKRITFEEASKDKNSLIWEMCNQDLNNIKGRTAFDAAEKEDECGKRIVSMYISYLADGISGLSNIFRPSAIIVGGGVAHQGDSLFIPLNEAFKKLCYAHESISAPQIIPAALGDSAGIIGAGLIGFSET